MYAIVFILRYHGAYVSRIDRQRHSAQRSGRVALLYELSYTNLLYVVARLDDVEESRADVPCKLLLWAAGLQSFENHFSLKEGENGTLYVVNRDDGTEACFAITGYISQYWLPSGRLSGR